ncbi:MAG: right-handed parallel beta-helix repeat-containing protein [Ferruginibacter sp.]
MKNLYTFFIVLAALACTSSAQATDYYFSAAGNDNNAGTSESLPFRTLAKASTLSLSAGDRMLFRRGDVFRGELLMFSSGTVANPVTIGSYGSGADAVISGSEYINNWVSAGNGIYRAACPVYPQMVFQNGVAQQLARYPNQGFLFTDAANGNSGFADGALPNSGSLYVGAGVHIRTARFRYEERTISVQSGTYLGFNIPTVTAIVAGAGYYLSGKLEFVDTAGEYYYDAAGQQLYLKTADGQAPADNTVEASRYDNGIKVESSANLSISHITIAHQQKNGVLIYGAPTSGLSISDCNFSNIYLYAITGSNKDLVTVTDSRFSDIWSGAFYLGGITNVTISNNVFKRIGIAAPGRATDDKISYKCIDMNGSSGIISNNVLDSIGNNGIEYYQNTTVERNTISSFCMTTDDGAGIVAHGTMNGIRNGTGCTVRYNIVSAPVGNAESYPFNTDPFVNGIGMDDNSGNAIIEYNTVYNVIGRGISIHNSSANQVRNNTVFNCSNGSLVFEHDYYGGMLTDNVASGNILYNVRENEYGLKVVNWHQGETGLNFGSFTGNYYINPYSDAPLYTAEYGNTVTGAFDLIQNDYSVRGWQALKDATAKWSPVRLDNYRILAYTGNDLVTNGNFDANLSGWDCWAQNSTCNTAWQSGGGLDGGNVKVTSPWYYYGNFYNSQLLSLEQNKQYLLSYSVIGDANKITNFNVQDRNSWAQLTTRAKKEVATTRLNHKLLLTPNANTTAGQLTFYIGPEFITSYSLDNIKLQEVTTATVDPFTQNVFFVNSSNTVQTIPLTAIYLDVDSNVVSGSIILQPFTSKILITTSQAVLPLNVLNIYASPLAANSSKVEWEIATADAACSMELQKSTDGAHFQTIAAINVQAGRFRYEYTDPAFTQTCYYRIKTQCAGEQERYSSIVQLLAKEETGVLVYPNPVTGSKITVINNAHYTAAKISGTDGRLLLQSGLRSGANTLLLPAGVPAGTYLLELRNDQQKKTIKLVKQ